MNVQVYHPLGPQYRWMSDRWAVASPFRERTLSLGLAGQCPLCIRIRRRIEPMSKNGVVDETDLKILKLLRMDARLSFREIGKQIKVSTGTVSDRVKQMQRDGIIKGFVTAIAPDKLGYQVTMLVELNVGREKTMEEVEA
ncbi:MAG: winged helix-turn-helix transcriptional regulator, partial [Thermoplasmata archaeon]|nr:winged helix-turn-helix transcriptional regulator [Thermoplasmata archaeon]